MKSVRELATELNVSPQAIRNEINRKGFAKGLQRNGKGFAIDEETESLIKSAFETRNAKQNGKGFAKEFAKGLQSDCKGFAVDIQKELDEKNRQIERLQEENKRLISALEAVTENLKGAQLLHAKTLSERIEEKSGANTPEDDRNASERKIGTLARFFKRKKTET